MSVLRSSNNVTSWKNQKKSIKAPKENIGLTDRLTYQDSQFSKTNIQRKIVSYLLDILLILLKFFLHFQLCQTNLNQFAKCYSYNSFVRNSHAIWSVDSILGNNSRTKNLPSMEFGMESQVSHSFSFQKVLREIKCQTWKKKIQNALFWGPFCPNIWAKVTFVQNYTVSVFRWKNVTSWKKQRKLYS